MSDESVLNELAKDYIKERRRKRRWGIFFKFTFVLLIFLSIFTMYFSQQKSVISSDEPHAALIDIRGPIFDTTRAKADNIAKSLRYAYKDKNTKGIILRINSPGGSPVQADYAFNEIRRLRKLHPKIKIYAVCTDLCASAAYYIAAAADKIYADKASLVGSIGVIYNGFGFVDAIQKLGVKRRLVTAGKNKGFMDPFTPMEPEQEAFLKNMLHDVHQVFINSVKKGRGNRLQHNPEIFSGLFWTGIRAKQLGLIDGFGSAGYVAREIIKTKKIVNYTIKENYLARLAKRFGTTVSSEFAKQLGLKQDTVLH